MNDDKSRTGLAIGISLVFMIIWFKYVMPPPTRPEQPAPVPGQASPGTSMTTEPATTPATTEPTTTESAATPVTTEPGTTPATVRTLPEVEIEEAPDVTIGNEGILTRWASRGGTLVGATLEDYPSKVGSGSSLALLNRLVTDDPGSLAISLGDQDLSERVYAIKERGPQSVTFTTPIAEGVTLEKTLFVPTTTQDGSPAFGRHVEVSIAIVNESETAFTTPMRIGGPRGLGIESHGRPMLRGVVAVRRDNDKVKVIRPVAHWKPEKAIAKLHEAEIYPVLYAGVSNRYFCAILIPDQTDWVERIAYDRMPLAEGDAAYDRKKSRWAPCPSMVLRELNVQPGERIERSFRLYLGPKKPDALAEYELSDVIYYGWFGAISRILLGILGFFHRIIPNYGIAIILLTLLVRTAIHPLSRKQARSMRKMQELQPKMAAIKERYKNNQKRQNEELMKLYREEGVNPLGGCLPMFFQMPIFIGLYQALWNSIRLRHEPFMLWINDLSQPDRIGAIGGFGIHVLPIVMVALMIVQFRMNPKPQDGQSAQQQKVMMMIMPLFFGYICYGMPAGVTLYWLTSSLVGILEQWHIRHTMKKEKEAAA